MSKAKNILPARRSGHGTPALLMVGLTGLFTGLAAGAFLGALLDTEDMPKLRDFVEKAKAESEQRTKDE